MNWKLAVLFVALTAGMAEGQYAIKSRVGVTKDITSMTATVNAWKTTSAVCKPSSITVAVGSQWCLGYYDNNVYKFNSTTKNWDKQVPMGTSAVSLAVQSSTSIYALMSTSQCSGPNYGFFNWIGSWAQRSGCFAQISADYHGFLVGIDNLGNMSSSSDGGNTWILGGGNWISANLGPEGIGCAVGADHSIWLLYGPNYSNPNREFSGVPSGQAAGCLRVSSPVAVVAWNTAGAVYVMPLETYGTWQPVTGLTVNKLSGVSRYAIFGEDSTGRIFHWNVNAPGMQVTYGGTWNAQNGCPSPGVTCNPSTTHRVCYTAKFKNGNGIDGKQYCSTQVYTNDISVTAQDYNSLCDPFVTLSGDVQCQMILEGEDHCNQANADIGGDGPTAWVIDDSIDIQQFQYNLSTHGPLAVTTGTGTGYYLGDVLNSTGEDCPLSDPIPVCPAGPPQGATIDIFVKAEWFGGPYWQQLALADWDKEFNDDRLGVSSPYVVHSFYTAEQLPDGSLIDINCFGGWTGDGDYLYGNIEAAPHCK